MKKIFSLTLISGFLFAGHANAQLFISAGSTFFIQPSGVVTVQGDVTGNADIQGGGKVLLKGSANQNVNMNGFTIPNLEIDNTSNATLTGNTRIGSSLLFTNGKILAGNFNMNLANVATVSGGGTSKFIETAGTGQVIKELTTDVTASEIPVGAGTLYRPAFITTTGAGTGTVGVQVTAAPDPHMPVFLTDYISAYWPVTKSGATGTVTLTGQYDNSDLFGTEANLRGYYFKTPDWSSASETHNTGTNQISAPITAATGELSALDKFVFVSAKALLQGPYQSGGVMSDALRAGTSVIPLTDPYRLATYSTAFPHVNNSSRTESAAASVFADHGNNTNIVDWVYLELRNNTTPAGNTILETRSALIERNGNIVDIDGVSPVVFNNIPTGSYTLAVRHRNHLGLSTDPAAFTLAFDEKASTVTQFDFTTATDVQLFGTNANYVLSTDPTPLKMLFAGNGTQNGQVRFTSGGNDKDFLLITVLGNNPANFILNTYSPADYNMNKSVRFTSGANDKDMLLINALGNNPATVRNQALPL